MARKSRITQTAEYIAVRALMGALRWVPPSTAYRLAGYAAYTLDRAVPKLRRVGNINLAFALPELDAQERRKTLDGVFQTVARSLVAVAKFSSLDKDNIGQWIGYDGLENYLAAKAEGKGVLVATAHLGNWELSAFAHALMTERMHVMVRPLDNPLLDRYVQSRRQSSGNVIIGKKEAARAVLKALRSGEAVGVLIDQNAAINEGEFIRFFGEAACANSAFIKLAYHSGAPVIPGFAFWLPEQQRYVLRFYPRIELTGKLHEDLQRLHDEIERVIRQYPDQWMWIHRRWKTRPVGQQSLYER